MDQHSRTDTHTAAKSKDKNPPRWLNAFALLISVAAGAVTFLPFALNTSPWDAVTLRVPGNQGNWWHALIGAPFFLAYPIIWLRLRSLFATQLSTTFERLVWTAVGLSIGATTLVQLPFLLHLAGTSEWQRFWVLSLGFGIVFVNGSLLFLCRRRICPTEACLIGLNTAYLSNTALCLVIYGSAVGNAWSRSGWLVSIVIVWPITFDLVWQLIHTLRRQDTQIWNGRS